MIQYDAIAKCYQIGKNYGSTKVRRMELVTNHKGFKKWRQEASNPHLLVNKQTHNDYTTDQQWQEVLLDQQCDGNTCLDGTPRSCLLVPSGLMP